MTLLFTVVHVTPKTHNEAKENFVNHVSGATTFFCGLSENLLLFHSQTAIVEANMSQ